MSKPFSMPRWVYVAIGVAMIAGYLFASIKQREVDSRPLGTLADISSLRDRQDLNILFIVVDTLRAGRLGAYGYERDTSPALSSLARSGIRFANHYSQSSWTKSSMASLWTSLYPVRNGVLRFDDAVSPDAQMPAETLKAAGFRTAAIWRNGWVAPNFGFAQGFDSYHNPRPIPIPPSVRRENPSLESDGSDHELVLSAIEFLRTYGDQRFFLYLHLMDVHQYVYDEETAIFGTTYSDIYDSAVLRTDHHIGSIIDALEQERLRDKTLIILVADHGEAFGEHGFEGHAKDLYTEVTRIPWIVGLPFRLESPVVVESRTENVDVWPTIFDLIGMEPPRGVDGRSRVDAILGAGRGETATEQRTSFAQLDRSWGQPHQEPRPLVAVTDGPHRLFYDPKEPDHVELYDLDQDPHEQKNISQQKPDVVSTLRDDARKYLDSPGPPWSSGAPKVEIDDMQLRQLRALGYKVD